MEELDFKHNAPVATSQSPLKRYFDPFAFVMLARSKVASLEELKCQTEPLADEVFSFYGARSKLWLGRCATSTSKLEVV
jgi:hypothetical protein